MKGQLYQIFGEDIEELYWSKSIGQEDFIKDAYKECLNLKFREDFEDWFNRNFEMQVERVFIEEIYV